MKKNIFLILVLLLSVCQLYGQAKMELDAPEVVDLSEDYFQIRFTVNDMNVSQFTPPSLQDFELLSGPYSSVSSSSSYINGKATHKATTTYTYTLAPLKKGTFEIGEATAVVNGKTVHSAPRSIKVIGDAQSRTQGSASKRNQRQMQNRDMNVSGKDLFITVSSNRKKIYVQEPVLLTYKFYARPDVMLSQIGIQKKPDFKGMLSQDIAINNIHMSVEDVNDVAYRTGVIQKYVLFPQTAGKITIPGITFNCDVIQRDVTMDPLEAFFNGGGTISKTLQRSAEDVNLEILPLPQPQPAGFSGGVGQISIKGEMLTREFKTNDVVTYRITVTGKGNLKLITTPDLNLSEDFDEYTPKVTDHTEVTEQGIQGKMVYEYTFVPRKVGEYVLPAVKLTYFDPNQEKYKTVSTQAFTMKVVKGERTNEEYQKSQQLVSSDIRELHITDASATGGFLSWGNWKYWLSYVVLVLIAFFGMNFLTKYLSANSDLSALRRKKAGKMASRRLKKAKSYLRQSQRSEFYTETSHALYGYVSDKYGIVMADLNRSSIVAEFQQRGVAEETVNAFIHLLDECDFAQYAPSSQVMPMEEMYEKAIRSIIDIENYKK